MQSDKSKKQNNNPSTDHLLNGKYISIELIDTIRNIYFIILAAVLFILLLGLVSVLAEFFILPNTSPTISFIAAAAAILAPAIISSFIVFNIIRVNNTTRKIKDLIKENNNPKALK